MKKIFAIITLLALVFTSCQKEEMILMGSDLDTITATIESTNDTKATLDDQTSTVNVKWSENDEISVFIELTDNVENVKYTLSSVNSNGTGVFTKTTDIDISGGTIKAAIYPYDENAIYTDGSITNVSTKVQHGHSINPEAGNMAAKVNGGTNIAFKNIGALVKVTTPKISSTYSMLKLSSETSFLSGDYSVSFNNDGIPAVTPSERAMKHIFLQDVSTSSETVDANQTFYFHIFTGNYSDLTVKAIGGQHYDQELVLIAPKALTAERSKLYYTSASVKTVTTGVVTLSKVQGSEEQNIEIATEDDQISVATEGSEPVSGKVNISINSNEEKELTITLPDATVLLSGKTTYSSITASTAENTLILGNGVTVEKVIVNKGNVQVNKGATLNGIELGTGITSATIIDNGGNININQLPDGIKKMSPAEFALQAAVSAGGEITLTDNINLEGSVNITKDVTINLNGKELVCNSSDVFIVTAGTLTINGTGLVYGSKDNSSSACAVWVKENGNAILNGGTYKVGHDGAAKQKNNSNWRNDCIYVRDNGKITINGGEFEYTGEVDESNYQSNGHIFLLNCRDQDYKARNCSITVKGGTFHKFNPAETSSENPVANYLPVGYSVVAENDVYAVSAGIKNQKALQAAVSAGGEIILTDNINLEGSVNITKDVTINLNGKELVCNSSDVFIVTAGTLTINGTGLVYGSKDNSSSACAVWVKENGNAILNGGTYKVGHDGAAKQKNDNNWRNDCIYVRDNGKITINGGEFEYTGEVDESNYQSNGHIFLLNCRDQDYKARNCSITVKGGSFHKFNPAETSSENPVANYLPAGYISTFNNNWYTVSAN